jgi:hypothetical protein
MFLDAPMNDKLSGDVRNVGYWVDGNNIVIEDNQQRGHLPSVMGDNFLTLSNSKVMKSTFIIPKFTSVTYVVNNAVNKDNFIWNLYRTGEDSPLMRVRGVSFFMWLFTENGSYDVEVTFTDDKGNTVIDRTDNFTKVVNVDEYRDYVNDWLTSRSYNLG